MKEIITVFLSFLFIVLNLSAQNLPAPEGLLCDLLREPSSAVITNKTVKFSWIYPQSKEPQKAYRILVASTPFLLEEGKADYWDSKWVSDNRSVNIEYQGNKLKDNSVYWWAIKIIAQNDLESAYSLPQQFHTGNFHRSGLDYPGQSKWIQLSPNNWVSEDKQRASLEYLDPVRSIKKSSGYYFIAFNKSVIGTFSFLATAQKNTSITIYMGERKNENQTVHKNPGRSNIGFQKIEMELKKGTHNYLVELKEKNPKGYLHSQKLAPHYPEVMPFRYVEIVGDEGIFQIENPKQAALFYYFDDSASAFKCSDEKLMKVWELCKYTIKATPFLGVYCDGNRERMPYEADANVQMLSHFAIDREYSIARYTINFLLDHASWPTEWQMHMVLMAWDYYMQTGDVSLLKIRYEDLKRKSLIALTDDNGLISTRTGKKTEAFLRSLNFPGKVEQFRDIVDWPQSSWGVKPQGHRTPLAGGETDNYVFSDYNTVVNAFHNRCLVLMAKIAHITGNKNDIEYFEEKAQQHRQAFNTIFFNEQKGIYVDGDSTDHSSLHANMYPMAFNLVPKEQVKSVAEFIKSRNMACSVYGAQYLLEALYNAGEADHALQLMTADTDRSWLNMLRVGSTMTTEAWDEFFKPNLTWNHAWGSAPANITARKLVGIEPLSPTFKQFRICPQPAYLEKATIRVPTIRGPIECSLVNKYGIWEMEVSIPGNADAELWLPAKFDSVRINARAVEAVNVIDFAGAKRKIFKLSSGVHKVTATKE